MTPTLLEPHTDLADSSAPEVIVAGDGCYVFDSHGRRYLEGVAGLWCATLGFSEHRLVDAATTQLRRLPFYGSFNHRTHDVALALADDLVTVAPPGFERVFLANSGSEANDTAIKLAWYRAAVAGDRTKRIIVSFDRGYHGVTVASGSATGLAHIHRGFGLPLPDFAHVATPDPFRDRFPGETLEAYAARAAQRFLAELDALDPSRIAAFIAEPILGAGGLIIPPPGFFARIEPYLRHHGITFIADEVITAFGRTGAMFATETYNLHPDIITVAKGLSAAYAPISAVLVSRRITDALSSGAAQFGPFGHGFTYSGHPLSAAVAREAIAIYQERDICGHVRSLAGDLRALAGTLAAHRLVVDVRVAGLLVGIELTSDETTVAAGRSLGAEVVLRAHHHQLIVRAMGDTIVLAPPLIANVDVLAEAIDRLTAALDDVAAELLAGHHQTI